MALTLVQAYARSGWRVRTVFNQAAGGVVAGDFTVVRTDGGPCSISVAHSFLIDPYAIELALSERMIADVGYSLVWSAGRHPIGFSPPPHEAPAAVRADGGDPDAEINGVDLAWISHDPGPTGDCQRRSGLACVQYDLPNRAVLIPGELVQDQAAGAALDSSVNGAYSDAELLQKAAGLEAEFRRDARIRDASVDPSSTSDGGVTFAGQVQTRAGQDAPVRST